MFTPVFQIDSTTKKKKGRRKRVYLFEFTCLIFRSKKKMFHHFLRFLLFHMKNKYCLLAALSHAKLKSSVCILLSSSLLPLSFFSLLEVVVEDVEDGRMDLHLHRCRVDPLAVEIYEQRHKRHDIT